LDQFGGGVVGQHNENLDEVFAPHIPKLYNAAAKVLRHHQDSEDALQDGLLAAFRHLHQFQGRSKLSTWLHRIVVNAALMKLRSRGPGVTMTSVDEELEGPAEQRRNPEQEYSENERSRILAEAISNMPNHYRIVVQMCDIDGLMEKEAAQMLGMLVSVVKSRRHRARKMLAERLGSRLAQRRL